jgi:hypothetical protein
VSELRTEVDFVLPRGYLDRAGTLHRDGVMRLATAGDEILPLRDPRVQANPAYLTVILLSRVVIRLGAVDVVNPAVIEGLFTADLDHLQHLYNELNAVGAEPTEVRCPHCDRQFTPAEPADGVLAEAGGRGKFS